MQLRASSLLHTAEDLRGLALILADQAERTFEAVDLVQTGLFADLGSEDIRTPEELRARMSGPAVHARLSDQGRGLPQLDVIAVIDANGYFINLSRVPDLPTNSIADRSYFLKLKSGHGQDVVISEPLRNRRTGAWSVVVAHRITSPDGAFLGITFAGVLMEYFEALYAKVVDRAELSVALLNSDGTLFARYPRLESAIGMPSFGAGLAKRLDKSILAEDITRHTSRIDGRDRLIAGHALEHYPFVIAVTADVSAALEPWRKQTVFLIGAATLLELFVVGLGQAIAWQLRNQSALTEARAARAEAEAAKRSFEAEVALGLERERADREMRVQNVRFGAALGNMSQALCMFAADNHVVVANRRLSELLGVAPADIVSGMTIEAMRELLEDRSNLGGSDARLLLDDILRLRADGKRASEVREMTDGRSIAVNFAPVEDGGWVVTLEDITERRSVEAKIAHMAHHDALTSLPNRVLFHKRLSEAVARSKRGEACAVLFLDLDHFKQVNDTLGHPVGDALLREVTHRLVKQVRETDTVARLGGDEFAIVQGDVNVPLDTTSLAARIISVLSSPYHIDGHEVSIGTSIGIALAPNDGNDPDMLLKNADMALYRAKAEGRGRYRYFEPEMDTRLRARRQLELDLRKALGEGEFRVFYQPLVNLKSGRVCGFEALVRWFHPERGMVSPADFVPVAEEIGLIVELGDWVLRQACRDAASWPGSLKVAVNLSPIQLTRRTVVEDVAAALRESGLSPKRLELEITETAMIDDTDAVLVLLHQIRDIGVRIALDDFGTGYSSLSYLLRFPFSKVKIDRSFIIDVGEGGDSDAIVAAVITLCHALGMTITAEGVETYQQLKYISHRHCTEAQGYLFSKPRADVEVADMIIESERKIESLQAARMDGV